MEKTEKAKRAEEKEPIPPNGNGTPVATVPAVPVITEPAPAPAPAAPILVAAPIPAPASTAPPPAPVVSVNSASNSNLLVPKEIWPPPIYIDANASESERYYMEHRWYSQWSYYDNKASAAKKQYHRYQLIAVIGAGTVTALVGLSPIATDINARNALTVLTVLFSLAVTSATAIEAVVKHGDAWRNYRSAAEELKQEKSLYDVKSGAYRKSKKPFLLFVERSEEVMAKQNGSWASLSRDDQTQQPQGGTQPVPAPRGASGDDDDAG